MRQLLRDALKSDSPYQMDEATERAVVSLLAIVEIRAVRNARKARKFKHDRQHRTFARLRNGSVLEQSANAGERLRGGRAPLWQAG